MLLGFFCFFYSTFEISIGTDFIYHGADIPEDEDRGVHSCPLLSREDEQLDVEEIESEIQARYARSNHAEYGGETTEVE